MKVIDKNPCCSCPGNYNDCSLTDDTAKYNALNCELIEDWVLKSSYGHFYRKYGVDRK